MDNNFKEVRTPGIPGTDPKEQSASIGFGEVIKPVIPAPGTMAAKPAAFVAPASKPVSGQQFPEASNVVAPVVPSRPAAIVLPTIAPAQVTLPVARPASPAANITAANRTSTANMGTEPLPSNALDGPSKKAPHPTRRVDWRKPIKAASLVAAALALLGGGGYVISTLFFGKGSTPTASVAGNFSNIHLPLEDVVDDNGLALLGTRSLVINGPLLANDSFTISPSGQPSTANRGQLYFDGTSNQLAYFDGTTFVPLGRGTTIANISGNVNLGNGLSASGQNLNNTGVLSLQGQTGNVTLTGGAGIDINGTTISNIGVISATAGTPNIQVTDDGAGNITISSVGGGTGTVISPGGTAGRIAKFTGVQTIEDSLLSESGATVTVNGNLSVTGALSLSTALSVGNGGTGATSLANNGVLVGQGAGAVTAVTAAGPGLCLVSTGGAPAFAACSGGGAVTSLNGLTGALTLANASGVGSTITIDDASTSAKGIAQFNATNFSVGSGIVNTIQNINTTASPTFLNLTLTGDLAVNGGDITSTGALNITPTGALTVGAVGQTALLQGTVTTITSNGAGNDVIINSADTIELQDNTNVTGAVDVSGALTSGTANAFQVAANGNITTTGNATVQGGLVTIGTTTTAGSLSLSDGSSNTGLLQVTALGADRTYTLPDASGTICLSTGNCAGAGVTLQSAYNNSTNPEIVVDATRGALTVRDNATPIAANLFEVQNNGGGTTYFGVSATGISVTGTATVSSNINSSGGSLQTNGTTRVDNSGNLANIGNIALSGTISGGTTITGSGNINTTGGGLQTNSVTRVDNSGNLTNIGNLGLSGSISGGTTYSGSGNINTTGGALQTNSVTRVDNTGNLLNIGNLTATGAITVSSTGAGNDVIINSADTIELQDNTNVTGVLDVSGSLNVGTADALQVASNGNITTAGTAAVQGGNVTIGTSSQAGVVVLSDGSSNTGTIQVASLTGDHVYTLPNATGTICLDTGNCGGAGATLQTAYNNSTNPEIVVDATRGALTVRDNATPIAANLLEVQSNNGGVTYFGVTASGVAVTGTATVSGNINSSGGALQTAGTTRVDNSGNLTNIGNLGLSGTISGGTTITGSGNINTTGGSLQTNSVTRVDNSGNLTNIGNITGTGAVTIASSGAGNDVIINGTDEFIVQDAAVFNSQSTFNTDVDLTFADTENLSITNTVTGTNAVNLISAVLTNNTSSAAQNIALLQNAAGSGTTDGLLVLDNADTDTAVTSGLLVSSAAGGVTTAIDVSDPDIVTALLFGLNDITGTNFSVTGSTGSFTSAGNGTLQGGVLTVGTNSQAGTLVLHDGSSNTGTLQVASLGQDSVYTLPDPGPSGTATICLTTGNCTGTAVTLQTAYDNSSTPEIVLDATRGALTLRDNATPLAANLFEVQSNNGASTYLAVTATGISVTGTAVASGNINSSGGALQTNGTTRIDNSGNATNLGTVTGSGNFNTTGGSLQTNSVTRVDNSGNLTNIGNITGTGAITIASSGAGNDIIINGNDEFIVQDAAVFNANGTFNGLATFNTDLDVTLADTENVNITNTVTGTNAVNLLSAVLTNNTSSATQNIALLQNAAGSGTTDGLLVLDNADTDTAVTNGLLVSSAAGGVTTAIDVSDPDIVTALLFGLNDITGTNFSVTGSTGSFTSAGNGTLQGGVVTVGTSSQAGTLVLSDGSSSTGTLQVAALGGDRVYTLPDATGEICLSTGNCSGAGVTLQSAYNNSSTPEIVLDATRGALTLRNNVTPIGANLFEVQNNAGSTTYLAVDAAGIAVTGNADISGSFASGTGNAFTVNAGGDVVTAGTYNTNTFTSSSLQFGGATTALLQSAASQALTITANAASIWSTSAGDLTLQGASGLNLKSATGNVSLGTSDTTGTLLVLDIKTNAGDPAGTDGAIYYNSNIGSFRCYQGAWTNCITASGGFVSLQNAYDNGNTIGTDATGDIAFTLNAQNFTVTTAAGAAGTTSFTLADGSNGSAPAQLVLVNNADTDQAVAAGLKVSAAGGGITNGIDLSDTDITNAIAFGLNNLDGTNFDVDGATGNITSAGDGLLQGGALTLGTSSQVGSVVFNDGAGETGTLTVAALGQPTTYNLIDPGVGSVDICLSSGNCAGSGGGVTGTGTNDRLAKFTTTGSTIGDSTISDNGTTVTTSVDMIIQGGDFTIGTTSQAASLLLHDGSGQTTTIQAGNSVGNLTFILPTSAGSANQCLKQSGTGNQLVWDNCDGGAGGSSGSLQDAYDNSASPEITVDTTRGAVTIRDNSSAIGANLLEVQNNAGSTTYLAVDATGIAVTGVISATSNINTTTGNLQTNSITRVENDGDLVNIGNITGTGAITIASSASGDVIIDGADEFIVQDAATFNALSTFTADVDFTLAGTENVSLASDLAGSVSVLSVIGTPSASAGTTRGIAVQQANSANTNGLDAGVYIDNADTDLAIPVAISIQNTGGGDYTNVLDIMGTAISAAELTVLDGGIDLGTETNGNYVASFTAGIGLTGDATGEGSTPTLSVNTSAGVTTSGDNVVLDTNYNPTWTADHTFNFAGAENIDIASDLGTTVNMIGMVGTPSASAGTTRGIFLQQANSANTNGLDQGITIDNADTDLAITTALTFSNSGGGGYTNILDVLGTGLSASELTVLDGGIDESEVVGEIEAVTAGNGLTGGGAAGSVTLDIASGNGGIVVNANDVTLTVAASADALSATTSSGSGLEVLASGLSLLQGCSDSQTLKWNETTDVWACANDTDTSSNSFATIDTPSGTDPVADSGADTLQLLVTGTNLTITGADSPETITFDIAESVLAGNGIVANGDALDLNVGNGLQLSSDAVSVNQNFAFTWTADHTFNLNGTENLDITSDLAGSVNMLGLVGTPSASAGTTRGIFIQQAASANTNGLDNAVVIDNADTDLAIASAIQITNSGGGNYTNIFDILGTGLSASEVTVLDGGIDESEVTGEIEAVTAGNGVTGGGAAGSVTIDVASGNGGIVVNANDISLTVAPSADALSATTSSGSGLEIIATGLTMLQGCSDTQILKWNETADVWACANDTDTDTTSNSFATIDTPSGTDPVADSPTDTLQLLVSGTNLTITGADSPETITFDIAETVLAGNGLAANSDALDINVGNGLQLNSDAVRVNQDFSFAWTADHTFTLAGSEDLAIVHDGTGGTVDALNVSVAPSSTAGVLNGMVITQTNSANTNGLDAGLRINNADTDLAVPAAIQIANTGGGGYTTIIDNQGTLISGAELNVLDGGIDLGTETNGNYVAGFTAGTGLTGDATGEGSNPTLSVNTSAGVTTSGDSVVLDTNYNPTWTADHTFNFAGAENIDIASDLGTTVNMIGMVGTPSASAGTTRGIFLQQANSANTNGLDQGITIDNADTDLAITTGLTFSNSGGGGYTNILDVLGAGLSAAELTVLDGGIDETEVVGEIEAVTAGNGVTGGGASGSVTIDVASGNGGIVVNANDISLTVAASANGLSATTSSGSGLEILASGLSLLQGCADSQTLKWNETTDVWACGNDTDTTANSFATIDTPSGTDPVADSATDTLQLLVTGTNLTITGADSPETITFDIAETVLAGNGLAANGDALDINVGNGLQLNSDAVRVNQDFSFAWTADHTFTLAGSEDIAITHDGTGGAVDALNVTVTPSLTAGVMNGMVITQAASANTNPMDAGLRINNADNDVAIPAAIQIANTGGGNYTNIIDVMGTALSAAELTVLDGGIDESEVTGEIEAVTAGNGVTGGGAAGSVTIDVASGNGGIVVNTDDITLTVAASANGLSATTSSGSGLEVLASGLTLLQGCADNQILKWNETTDVWSCAADADTAGSVTLQSAYDNDADGSDTTIALSSADDSLIIRNPSSAGTDSGFVAQIDQLNTGGVDALRITNAGTGVGASIISSNAATTGNVLLAQSNSTGAVTNGLVRFNLTGAHTGNGVQIDDATATGTVLALTANSLTSGIAQSISSTGTITGAGSLLSIAGNNATTATGLVNVSGTGITTGNVVNITGNSTASLNGGSTLNVAGGRVNFTPTQTVASAAGAVWNGINFAATTATLTGSTAVTTATGFNFFSIAQPTITDSSAVTVTNAATMYIADAPVAAGSATITNPYALWVDNGATRLDGVLTLAGSLTRDITTANAATATNLTFKPGDTTNINGTGATLNLTGGDTATGTCGTSCTAGAVNITGGTTSNPSGTRNGGNVNIDGGVGNSANGVINIGTINSGDIFIGKNTGGSTTVVDAGSAGVIIRANGSSTGVIQIGAGGAGTATPDYLALDVKSTTGDPAGGVEGEMYYNTFDNKFRCFQGAAWTDCISVATTPTLQTVYDADVDGSDAVIALTTGDDSIIFRNPSSSGTDSGFIAQFDQLNTGNVDGIRITNAGTGVGASIVSSNAATTGNVLLAQSNSTGVVTNGLARFNFTGAHTGNGVQIDDATATGTALALTANSLSTGVGANLSSTGTITGAGSLLSVAGNNATTATGLVNISGTGITTGNVVNIAGNTTGSLNGGNTLNVNGGRVTFTPTQTVASAAGAVWNGINYAATTATLTGSTGVATATGFNFFSIAQPTITDASAVTVTNAATLYIANAPAQAGSATITNPYALWIDNGTTRLDGTLTLNSLASASTTYLCLNGANVASCSTTGVGAAFVNGGNSFGGATTIGTNDANDLAIERNNATQLTVGNGVVSFASNVDLTLSGATAFISNPQGLATSEFFGANATFEPGSTANVTVVGAGSKAGDRSVSFGAGINNTANDSVAIGYAVNITSASAIAIGSGATAGSDAIAIGDGADASNPSSIAIGFGATSSASNQLVIGSNDSTTHHISDVYIGSGVVDTTPNGVTINGTGGSGSDIAGAAITIAGGKGTGTGVGGNINFQIAKPTSTGSTLNTLSTVLSVSGTTGTVSNTNTATGTSTLDLTTMTLTNQTSSGTQRGLVITNANDAANATTEALVLLDNAETTASTVTDALRITSSGVTGGIVDAIDASDSNITNALNVGDNTVIGTAAVIDFSNFDVASTGDVTLGENADHTISIATRGSDAFGRALTIASGNGGAGASGNDGGSLNLFAGDANGTGDANGGTILIQSGDDLGGGDAGRVLIRPGTGTESGQPYFSVQNNSGTNIFGVGMGGNIDFFGPIINNNYDITFSNDVAGGIGNVDIGSENSISSEGNGQGITFHGGSSSDAASAGGSLILAAGSGTSSNGFVSIENVGNSTTALRVMNAGNADRMFAVDTTNNRVIVGNATAAASANSTLFVVDSASTANAPSGTNGGIFYDTSLGKFRCFEGGAYVNCITAGSTPTLQTVYDNDADGSDAIMSLTTADDSVVFRNPSSSGTDSGFIAQFDQLNTGGVDAIRVTNAGTGVGVSIVSSNAATTGNVLLAQSNSTGVVTNGLARFNFTGAHTGNGVQIDDATATGTAVAINSSALTTGSILSIVGSNATQTGTGLLVQSNSTGAVANGLARFNFSAAHTGNGVQIDDATATGTAEAINVNSLTSGTGLSVTSTNAAVTGNMFRVQSNSTGAVTNGLARFNFSAAHTGNGIQVDDATATGTVMAINSSALTSGSIVSIIGSNAAQTGTGLLVQSNSTGAVANGLARFNFSAAHTGVGVQIDDATATGTAEAINVNSLTSGTGWSVTSTNAAVTGNLFRVQSNSTGAVTNGLARFNFSAAHTGNGVQIDDATATGTAVAINASALTTGSAFSVVGSNAAQTGTGLLVQSNSTGVVANGLARFNFTGAHTGNGVQIDDATATGTVLALTANSLSTGSAVALSSTGTITGAGRVLSVTANNATTATGVVNISATGITTGSALTVTGNSTASLNGGNTLNVAGGRVVFTPTQTVASAAGAVWNGINYAATTATLTGSTAVTTATGFNFFSIAQPTITDASAVTVTNAATMYIADAPAQAGSATITNPYALWVDNGAVRLDGATSVNTTSSTALNVTNGTNSIFSVNTSTPSVTINGTGTNGAGNTLYFGTDTQLSIGEDLGTDSNVMAFGAGSGFDYAVNGTQVLSVNSSGNFDWRISGDSATAYLFEDSAGNDLFSMATITDNNEVHVGEVDAFGTLFVLDEKNTSGDPTGAMPDGSMYYNSNTSKFRCKQGGSWTDCITTLSATTWDNIGDPAGNGAIAFGATVQTMDWATMNGNSSLFSFNFTNTGGAAGTDSGVVINNAVSTNSTNDLNTENLLLIQQLDTTASGTTVVDNGLKIDSAGSSGIVDGIEITNSAGNITNGINLVDTAGGTFTTGLNFSGTFTQELSLSNGLTIKNTDDNDLDLTENSLGLNIDFGEATASTITQSSASKLAFTSTNGSADGLVLTSTNGGIDITTTGSAAGEDIDISAGGSSINLISTEAASDAIVIQSSTDASGVRINAGDNLATVNANGNDIEFRAEDDIIASLTGGGVFLIDNVTTDSTLNSVAAGSLTLRSDVAVAAAGTNYGFYIDYQVNNDANTNQTYRGARIDFTNSEDSGDDIVALQVNNVDDAANGVTDALLSLVNSETTVATVTAGLTISGTAGGGTKTITYGIDVSDDNILNGLNLGTNNIILNGDSIDDFTGAGLQLSGTALSIDATVGADGLSATTSSGSGLEVLASGLTMLQGCADTQILKWNETTDVWACAADNGGSATLQGAYDADTDTGDTIISLTTADDSIIFRNPSSSGTDSGFVTQIDQASTGTVDGLRITSVGTGGASLLSIADSSTTGNYNAVQVQSSGGTRVLGVSTLGTAGHNLVAGGSMERGINGWFEKGNVAVVINQTDETAAQQGNSLLKVATSANIGDGATYVFQPTASGTYSMSFWAKSTASTGANISFGHRENTTTGDVNCLTGQTLTTTWTQFTCSGWTANATVNDLPPTIGIYVKQSDATARTIYIDSVTLTATATSQTFDAGGTAFQIDSNYNNVTINNSQNGEIQPWRNDDDVMPATRAGAAVTTANGYMYVLGGTADGATMETTVYYARLNADGTTGAWASTTALSIGRAYAGATVANGYIYILGGWDGGGYSLVQYAKLNADGTVGTWRTNNYSIGQTVGSATTQTRYGLSAAVKDGFIYAIAGCGDASATAACTTPASTVYYAKLNADGSVGAWAATSQALTAARGFGTAAIANGYMYYSHGYNASLQNTTYFAPIASDGNITTAFAATGTVGSLTSRAALGSVVVNGYLYLIGGCTTYASPCSASTATITYARLNGDGTLGTWVTASNSLPGVRSLIAATTANGYIYIAGGYSSSTNRFANVFTASTARTMIAGSLDLVGLSSQNLAGFGGGGSLNAGNGRFIGNLVVDGSVDLNNGLSVDSAINLNAVSATTGQTVFNINNSSSNSIFSIRHMNANFGSLVTAGAYVAKNSYWAQEYNIPSSAAVALTGTVTPIACSWGRGDSGGHISGATAACAGGADTSSGQGDMTYSAALGNTANSCTPTNLTGINFTNGLERLTAAASNTAGHSASCAEYPTGGAAGASSNFLTATNLPVMTMKLKPSTLASNNGLRVFAGMWSGGKFPVATTVPGTAASTYGVYFTNCTATTPTCSNSGWNGWVLNASGTLLGNVSCSTAGSLSTTNFAYFRIEFRTATEVHFYVDVNTSDGINEVECGTGVSSGSINAGAMTPFAAVVDSNNATAVSAAIDIDYLRTWQDDNVAQQFAETESAPAEPVVETQAPLVTESAPADDPNALFSFSAATSEDTVYEHDVYVKGTLFADKIKANQIEGLEVYTNKLADLQQRLDDVANQASTENADSQNGQPSKAAPAVLGTTAKMPLDINVSGSLTVGGDATFQGNTFFKGLVTFVEKTVFKNDLSIEGRATFNNDTGGFATIHEGQKEVRVTFERPYEQAPVVAISTKNGQFVQYSYTDLTTKGFKIVLPKAATDDIEFSWIALSINGAKTTQVVPVAAPPETPATQP